MTAITDSLVGRTPLAARRLFYGGPEGTAFQSDYLARNPSATVSLNSDDGPEPFDCYALADGAAANIAACAARLAQNGCLVAAFPALTGDEAAALMSALTEAGLILRSARRMEIDVPFDDLTLDAGTALRRSAPCPAMIVVAQKAQTLPALLVVRMIAYSPYLMDIRTTLPAQGMRSSPDMAVVYSNAPASLPPVPLNQPKVLVLQRPALSKPEDWCENMEKVIRAGWLAVLEFDDHPQVLADILGIQPDWHRFSYPHAIQTSTPLLETAFREWNPEVRAFPNAVFDLKPFREDPGRSRVFFGAFRRRQFGMEIMRSLAAIPHEFPDVEFVVVGDRDVFDAIPTERKTYHPEAPYAEYLDIMGSCSISLSPIRDFRLVDTKSDAKFLDASSRSVLTIASPPIYRHTIRHGETGLIAERVEDWAPLLAGVLRDEPLRRRLARGAWEYVRDQRMFHHQLAAREAWYRSLWARRDELNKAVIGRVPGLAAALAAKG